MVLRAVRNAENYDSASSPAVVRECRSANGSKITFAYVFIYSWSVCIIKFSILALYRRIFGLTWLGWFCIAITTGYLITNHIVLPLYTRPLNFYWNQWYGGKGVVLVNEAKFYLGISIINLFGDVCILAIPIANVRKLNMGRSQKVAVNLTFLLGSFVCFASLYRLITINRLVHTKDISWAKSDVFIWSSVEPSVGIISGCLPTLRPLMILAMNNLSRRMPSTLKSSRHSESPAHSLDPLETISKKRTRKIKIKDPLESTVAGTESRVDRKSWMRSRTDNEHWGKFRPDDDEMCLTTTTVHVNDKERSGVGMSVISEHDREENGITMTRKFEWDERTHG
ncbi:hypothetical protein CFE70_010199 [Pyrenophora teres f. teres 0-1]